MESMAISKFKATCLAVLERVRQTGQPLLITKRGKPVALVNPPPPDVVGPRPSSRGSMKGTFQILGDLIEPAMSVEEWEAGTLEKWDRLNERPTS